MTATPRGALSRFIAADGFFMSAGLAFFFLVCLIPQMLLGVSLVGFVLSGEEAARHVVNQLAEQFPVYQTQIARVLLRIVQTRRASGLLGTAALVVFSTPVLSGSRLIMHRLLGVRSDGGFLRNTIRDSWMALLLSLLLFTVSTMTWLYHGFQALALNSLPVPPRWFALASLPLSLALSTVMFYCAYRYVPRRHVRVGPALAGAILASVLWEIAKQLFRFYIQRVSLYNEIYGPLAVLVAFAMFVYYSAIVFVFSAAFVAALDSRRR